MEEDKNIVDRIMYDTIEAIVENYGEVKPEWNYYLDKLKTQYTILFERQDIDGVLVINRESIEIEKNRHPLLYQMKRLLSYNQKLIEPDRKIIKIKKRKGKWQLIKKLLKKLTKSWMRPLHTLWKSMER